MEHQDFFWLIGLLEGEGYFSINKNSPIIALQMTDEDIVEKAAKLMGNYKVVSYSRKYAKEKGWKQTYQFQMRGEKALNLMKDMFQYLGKRRQRQILNVIKQYDPYKRQRQWKNSRIIQNSDLLKIITQIDNGKSLRACARDLNVHHESLRRAIKRFKKGMRL